MHMGPVQQIVTTGSLGWLQSGTIISDAKFVVAVVVTVVVVMVVAVVLVVFVALFAVVVVPVVVRLLLS